MTVPAERIPAALAPRRRGRARAQRERRSGRIRARLEYVALRAVLGILAGLPLSAAMRLAEVVAFLAYLVDRPHRPALPARPPRRAAPFRFPSPR